MELVRPYIVLPLRYPSFHAPDNHFKFPLPRSLLAQLLYTHMTPHGFYPLHCVPHTLASVHIHYNLRLNIAVSLITLAAKLLYFARSEATPFEFPPNLPVDRADALSQGYTHPMPTQSDYRQFNEHKGARVLEKGDWDWRAQLDGEEARLEDDGVWRKGLKAKSARWDNDWHRWCYCFDPWNVPELKGVVYTYGCLNGDWLGRMLVRSLALFHLIPSIPLCCFVIFGLTLICLFFVDSGHESVLRHGHFADVRPSRPRDDDGAHLPPASRTPLHQP